MARLIGTLGSSPGTGTPGVPTSVSATAGNAQATVSWTNPTYTGKGGTVTYRAVSSPGGFQATTTSNSVIVTGLSNGTAYTFTVRAETSYGINGSYSSASSSVTPVVPKPTVTGGTLTSDATYYYRTFTASGTLGVSGATLTYDYVAVGGGGGGGGGAGARGCSNTCEIYYSGGGGSGGRVANANGATANSNISITIGAGGAGGSGEAVGTNGSSTVFGSVVTSVGGSGGGMSDKTSPSGGAYGGGAGSYFRINNNQTSFTGTAGSGTIAYSGGSATAQHTSLFYGTGGGGGGAGGNGGNSSGSTAGAGGAGLSHFGTNYGGGGGGGASFFAAAAGSATSGGGAGGRNINGSNGTSNTGGGGGGSGADGPTTSNNGGSGGSGVVVVRYTKSQVD